MMRMDRILLYLNWWSWQYSPMDYVSASYELHDRELPRLEFGIAARDGLEKWSN
jgi:hypothetical protein